MLIFPMISNFTLPDMQSDGAPLPAIGVRGVTGGAWCAIISLMVVEYLGCAFVMDISHCNGYVAVHKSVPNMFDG